MSSASKAATKMDDASKKTPTSSPRVTNTTRKTPTASSTKPSAIGTRNTPSRPSTSTSTRSTGAASTTRSRASTKQDELEEMKTTHAAAIAALENSHAAELAAIAKSREEDSERTQRAISALESTANGLEQKLGALNADHEYEMGHLTIQHGDEMQRLRDIIEDLQDENTGLHTTLAEKVKEIGLTKAIVEDLQTKSATLQQSLDDALAQKVEDADSANTIISDLRDVLAEKNTEAELAKAANVTLQGSLNDTIAKNDEDADYTKTIISDLRDVLAEKDEEAKLARATITTLQNSLNETLAQREQDAKATKETVGDLQDEIAQKDKDAVATKFNMEDLHNRLAEKENAIASMNIIIEDLQNTIATSQQSTEDAEAETDKIAESAEIALAGLAAQDDGAVESLQDALRQRDTAAKSMQAWINNLQHGMTTKDQLIEVKDRLIEALNKIATLQQPADPTEAASDITRAGDAADVLPESSYGEAEKPATSFVPNSLVAPSGMIAGATENTSVGGIMTLDGTLESLRLQTAQLLGVHDEIIAENRRMGQKLAGRSTRKLVAAS